MGRFHRLIAREPGFQKSAKVKTSRIAGASTGEHIVPEPALEWLADQNIMFTVKGRTTYEQQLAAIRGIAPAAVQ